MRSAICAEWIIARFTDRSRAVGIVGDLLEAPTQREGFWFWLSVAGIVLSLIWRRAIAFIAAFYVGLAWRMFATRAFYYAGYPGPRLHPWSPWEPLFSVIWFGAALSMVSSYAAIRYGLHDKFVQLALGFCGLITIVIICWRKPVVTTAIILLTLAILAASVRFAKWSRALAALTPALVLSFGGGLLAFSLRAAVENIFSYSLAGSDLNRTIVNIGFWSLSAWITMTACASMHDRLRRRDQRGTEIGPIPRL